MSRKKDQQPEKPKEGATITIDVDSFVRTRDSVVTTLATLQDALQTLSTAYIKHTNTILGEHGATHDVSAAIGNLGGATNALNPLLNLGGDLAAARAATPVQAAEAPTSGKKERKKRQHDPDAPKRPLTPFFLYMQTARPIIANDLGPDVAKGAVSDEGTRRWSTMDEEDKQLWAGAYKENLRLYNARMHFYRRGFKEAKLMSDADASAYAEEYNIGTESTADAQLHGEAAANLNEEDAEGEVEKEPTPPPAPVVKTPKAKASRGKGKATKAAAAVEEPASDAAAPTPSTIIPPKTAEKETPKSPDKKRKRTSKKSAAAEELSAEKVDEPVETPAKSASKPPRKKKAKADS